MPGYHKEVFSSLHLTCRKIPVSINTACSIYRTHNHPPPPPLSSSFPLLLLNSEICTIVNPKGFLSPLFSLGFPGDQTTSSQFLFLISSARGTQLILCKLGKEARREWGEAGKKPFFPFLRARAFRGSIALRNARKTLRKERDCSHFTR